MMNIRSDHSGSGSSEDLRLRISRQTGGGDEGSNTDQHLQLEWDAYADAGYDNHRYDNDYFRWIRESSSDHALSFESIRQEDSRFLGTFTNGNEVEFHSVASTEYLSVEDDDVNQTIRSENQQVELTFPKMALKLNLDVTVSDVDPATGKMELTCSAGDGTEKYTGLYRNGNIANCEMWLNGQCLQQQATRSSSSDIELTSEGPLFSESESFSSENLKSSSDSKLSYHTKATNTYDGISTEHLQTRYDHIERTSRLLNFSDEEETTILNGQIVESSTSLDRLIAWYNNGCSSSFESRDSDQEYSLACGSYKCISYKEIRDIFGLLHTTDLPSPPSSPPSSSKSLEEAHDSESDSSVTDFGDNTSPLNDSRPSWLTIYRSSTQFEPDDRNTRSELSRLHERTSSLDDGSVALDGPSNQQCNSGKTTAANRHRRTLLDLSESDEEATDSFSLRRNSEDNYSNPEDFFSNTEDSYPVGATSNSTLSCASNGIQTQGITEDLCAQGKFSRMKIDSSSALFDSALETMLQEVTDSTIPYTSSLTSWDTSATVDVTVKRGDDKDYDNVSSIFHIAHDLAPLSSCPNLSDLTFDSQPPTDIETNENPRETQSGSVESNVDTRQTLSGSVETDNDTRETVSGSEETDNDTRETLSGSEEANDDTRETLSGSKETNDDTHETLSGSEETNDDTRETLSGSEETNDDTRETLSGSAVSSGGIIDVESYSETSSDKQQYETSAFVAVYSLTDIVNENTGHAVDYGCKTETQCNPDTNAKSCDGEEDSLFLLKLVPSEEVKRKQSYNLTQEDHELSPAENDRKINEEKLRVLAASYGLLDDSEELGGYESYDSDDGKMAVDPWMDKVKSPYLSDDTCDVAVDSSVTSDVDPVNKERHLDGYKIPCEVGTNDTARQTSSATSSSTADQEDISGASSSTITSCENSETDISAKPSSTYDVIGPSLCEKDSTNFCSADEIQKRLHEHKQSRACHSNDSLFSFSEQDQVDFLMKFQRYVESLEICIFDRRSPRSKNSDMVFHADDGYFSCFDENQVKECNLRKFLGNQVDPLKTENVESMKMNQLTDPSDLLDDIARKLATRIISDISLCQEKSNSTSQSLSDATYGNGYSSDHVYWLSSDESLDTRYLSSTEDSGRNTRPTPNAVFSCPYFDDISRLDVFPPSVDDVGKWPISTMSVNDLASRSHSQFIDLFNTEKHAELINYSLNNYQEVEEDARVNLSDNKYDQSCVCDSNTESSVSEDDIARMPSDRYSFSVNSRTFIQHVNYDTDKRDTSKGTIMAEVEREALSQYACLLVKEVISSAHKKFVWSMEGLQEKDNKNDVSTSSGSESASSVEELVSSESLTNQVNTDKNETNKDEHSGGKSNKCHSDNNSTLVVTSCRDYTPRTSSLDYCRTVVATGLSSIAIRQGMNELRLVACKEWHNRSLSSGSSIDLSAIETDLSEQEPEVDNYTKYKSKLRELKMRRQRGNRLEQNKERLTSRPVEKKYLQHHQFSESSSDEASDDDSSLNDDDMEECERQIIAALHRENNETTISEIEHILDTETMMLKAKQAHHLRRLEKYRRKAESSSPSALCPDHDDSLHSSKQPQSTSCWCTVEKAEAVRNIAFEVLKGKQLLKTQQCISKMEDELMAMRKRIGAGQKAIFNTKSLDSPLYQTTDDQAKLVMKTETEALKTFLYKNMEDFEKAIIERPIFGAGDLKGIEDHTQDFTAFGRIINQEMKEFKDTANITWEDIQDHVKKEFENCLYPEGNEYSVQNNVDGFEHQEGTKQQVKGDSEEYKHLMKEEPDDVPADVTSKLTRIAEKAFRLHMSRQFLTEEYKQLKDNRLGVDLAAQLPSELKSTEVDLPPFIKPRCSICKLRKKVNKVDTSEANEKSLTNNTMENKRGSSTTIKRFGGHEYEVVTGCGIRKHTVSCALCKAMEDVGV
ncbi:uncharacterized protein LOC110446001 [Mizuhopecten yessoensis]|uniref:Uncharacterized protein n=1 Tax=Mizuhopecten yessoensis TaxID=6573 RepID=A0A210R6A5_MIZYE|nr:uncharacterized protein LOC110446001 [Mizuhopecten yessoensis]OWF56577.1 hypothetical protein KP79_PYT20945 [Mizuhopecten yessoensis]